MCEIPPASGDRWFRACVAASIPPAPPSNDLYYGGGVYPSSYLLPWTQNRGAEWRSHLYPTFSPFWSSSFFHHFFNTFLCWLWFDFGPNLEAKSLKNRSQDGFFRTPKLHHAIFWILLYLPCVSLGFEGRRLPKMIPKSIQFQEKPIRKSVDFKMVFQHVIFTIFIDLWVHVGTHFSSKIA